jgi:hypothetical protein
MPLFLIFCFYDAALMVSCPTVFNLNGLSDPILLFGTVKYIYLPLSLLVSHYYETLRMDIGIFSLTFSSDIFCHCCCM